MELLHTTRQGLVEVPAKTTLEKLGPDGVARLVAFLRTFDYSGLQGRFSSDLQHLNSFSGKEFGLFAQVVPLALLSIDASPFLIHAWCLIAELVVDNYSWAPRRSDLDHKRLVVSCRILKPPSVSVQNLTSRYCSGLR